MPNYSDLSQFPRIGDTLAAQGEPDVTDCRIGKFNQTTYNKYFNSVAGSDLSEGYCNGVVFDWLRRMLLNTRPNRDARYLTYNHELLEAGANKIGNKTLQKADGRAKETVKRMGTAYAKDPLLWTRVDNSSSKTHYLEASDWQTYQQQSDAANLRGKKFSSLTLIQSRSHVYDRPAQWLGAVLNDLILPGCGARLGFNVVGSEGHAVGVWRRRTSVDQPDSFYFFDPNYGVFQYNKTGLNRALCILFWYDDDDTPKYKDCCSKTATAMRYLVLGPPNPMDAGQNAGPQPSLAQPQPMLSSPPVQPTPPQPHVHVQPTPPQAQLQPQVSPSAHTLPTTGLASPGQQASPQQPVVTVQVPQPSVQTSTGTGLKSDLQKLKADTTKHMAQAKGRPNVAGGYVNISYTLGNKVKASYPDAVVLSDGKHVIAMAHLTQIIGEL